jgi:hypothetical protein
MLLVGVFENKKFSDIDLMYMQIGRLFYKKHQKNTKKILVLELVNRGGQTST